MIISLSWLKEINISSFLSIKYGPYWALNMALICFSWIPFTHGYFLASLDEIGALWFRRKLLNFVDVFLLFSYCLPSKKGVALHLNKLEFSSPKNDLCQVWMFDWLIGWCFMSYQQYGWKWPSGSGEKDDNVKSIQTEGWPMTDNQKSSLNLSAQVTPNHFDV